MLMKKNAGGLAKIGFKLPNTTPIIPGMIVSSPRKKYLPEASIFPLNEKYKMLAEQIVMMR